MWELLRRKYKHLKNQGDSNYKTMAESRIPKDWQLDKSLKERNAYMLQYAVECDVTFSVRDASVPGKIKSLYVYAYGWNHNSKYNWISYMYNGDKAESPYVRQNLVESWKSKLYKIKKSIVLYTHKNKESSV